MINETKLDLETQERRNWALSDSSKHSLYTLEIREWKDNNNVIGILCNTQFYQKNENENAYCLLTYVPPYSYCTMNLKNTMSYDN